MRALRFIAAMGVAAVLQFAGMQLFPWFTLAVDFFMEGRIRAQVVTRAPGPVKANH